MKALLALILTITTVQHAICQPVTIPDPNLDRAIREALKKEDGKLMDEDLLKLTSLRAVGKSIKDLTGLEHATNLTKLVLGANDISDIKLIASLTNLKDLYLWYNAIEDIAPLKSLTHLQKLDLGANKVDDLTPLITLKNLQALDLSGNLLNDQDLVSIKELPNLTWLSLVRNQLSDVCILEGLKLERLFLSNNRIETVSCLSSMTDLVWLKLDSNDLQDITALMTLNNLIDLDLHNNYLDFSEGTENAKWIKELESRQTHVYFEPQNLYSLFQKTPPHFVE